MSWHTLQSEFRPNDYMSTDVRFRRKFSLKLHDVWVECVTRACRTRGTILGKRYGHLMITTGAVRDGNYYIIRSSHGIYSPWFVLTPQQLLHFFKISTPHSNTQHEDFLCSWGYCSLFVHRTDHCCSNCFCCRQKRRFESRRRSCHRPCQKIWFGGSWTGQ